MTEWAIALRESAVESTAPDRGPRWRRRALFSVLTVVAMVAATLAAITYPWHSVGSAERLLQAVNVDLGSDGRVVSIATTNVHRTATRSSHDTARLDPSGDETLPVRIGVGYVMDGHVGHNLKEVAGKSGTIEVDVTVTNETQHSQLVSYSDATGTHQAYAQVAAPMTVLGTATLPKGSFSVIQTPSADPTSLGDNTDGVVQSSADGDTAVQWATVLAPPRLSATTTFRLVVTTTDFQLPHFTIAAKPGLVTDLSTGQLLGAAFAGTSGTDAADLLDVERNTVTTIANLQRQLADTGGQLADVKNELAGAGRLSHRSTAKLAATNGSLQKSSAGLSTALGNLDTALTTTLGAAKSNAKQQLDDAVNVVTNYIGTGSVKDDKPRALSQGCTADDLNKVTQPKTLLGELQLVTGQAKSLAGATPSCAGAISAELDTVIGPADAKDCSPTSQALVCDLDATSTALGALSDDIGSAQAQILANLDPSFHANVASDIGKLAKAVTDAQGQAQGLLPTSGPSSARKIAAAVTGVRAQVRSALGVLSSGTGGLASHLQTVHNAALSDLATLAPAGGASSIADQIAELDNRICNPPSDMSSGLDTDYVAVLNALVSGGSCGGTITGSASDPIFSTPLSIRVSTLRANLSSVLAQTDLSTGSATGLGSDFAPLRQRLESIDSSLGSIVSSLGKSTPKTGTLAANLAAVVTDLDSLYDAKAASASCSGAPSGATLPLNVLTQDFQALTCRSGAGVADVKALLGNLKVQGSKKSARVTTGTGTDATSAPPTTSTVDSLVAGLSQDLRTSAVGPKTLDDGLRQGVAAINRSIGDAGVPQPAATAHLRALVAMVLNYLGSTDDATAMVRAQIRQGMQSARSLPAFAAQQAAGSSHVTVYLFTLRAG